MQITEWQRNLFRCTLSWVSIELPRMEAKYTLAQLPLIATRDCAMYMTIALSFAQGINWPVMHRISCGGLAIRRLSSSGRR
jgi:hypothetical protein